MHITIAERLQPFSHTPGIYFILPGTNLRFQIFPALLRIDDLSGKEPAPVTDISIGIEGPVHDFTAMQDLERGELKIWGHSSKGYFRYRITPIANPSPKSAPFAITIEKQPTEREISWTCSQGFQITLLEDLTKQTLLFSQHPEKSQSSTSVTSQQKERLSLGNHKTQEWDKIRQRSDMSEVFPLWFRLGQLTPSLHSSSSVGTADLLNPCRDAIDLRSIEKILPAFNNLFLAGFDIGLSPRLNDEQHHGFQLPPISDQDNISPMHLLTEGAALIRLLFLRSDEAKIHILPALPPEFHCGRFLQAQMAEGTLDIEWTKKTVRRMIITATAEAELLFSFQRDIKQFRLRQKESERGSIMPCNTPIKVSPGNTYLFDCFQK